MKKSFITSGPDVDRLEQFMNGNQEAIMNISYKFSVQR